jgi:hypothetical protein
MKRGKQMVRGKALKAKPRGKGNRGELAIRDSLRERGYITCKRNWQSGGQGGGDLIEHIPDLHIEVKWHETMCMPEWIKQAAADARPTDTPAVVFRDNKHSTWWAVVPARDFWAIKPHEWVYVVKRHQKRWTLWQWIEQAIKGATELRGDEAVPIVEFERPDLGVFVAVPWETLLDRLETPQ